MIDLNIIVFLGLSGFVLFLFFYILKIEKLIETKFSSIESSIEEINKEIFFLKKKIKEDNSLVAIENLEKIIKDLVEKVKIIEKRNQTLYKKIEEDISKLKSAIKKSNLSGVSNVNKHEEDKILSLYKSGYTIEEISRELRIPAGEIELVVKFSDIYKT